VIEPAARQAGLGSARALAEQMTRRLADRLHTDSTDLLREDRFR
jgi:hypothetical protein